MPDNDVRINGDRRNYDSQVRKDYYAKRRQVRYAAFLWGGAQTRTKSTSK